MIHEYKTGRSVCGFVEFCAWTGVVIAAFTVLAALGTSTRGGGYTLALAGVVPALTLLIFSFILVVLTQMARATMDGSVAAQKNVIQSNKQHDEMMRALRSHVNRSPTTDAQAANVPKHSLANIIPKGADQPFSAPKNNLCDDDRTTSALDSSVKCNIPLTRCDSGWLSRPRGMLPWESTAI
ncbi:MAG: hypothetical protein AAGK02_06715 [Pseudomonadota bacterium]